MSGQSSQPYDRTFYDGVQRNAIFAARRILPLVQNWLTVGSVVDIGCGEATWLSVARELGVADVQGLDGDYVDRDRLLVPKENFRAVDLNQAVKLERTFDLAMCMEVAEHLSVDAGKQLVRSLCGLSKTILFSAAVPGQGGTGHVNEQWPDYWAGLFRERGFVTVDAIRRRVWNELGDAWWYAQNSVLYVESEFLARHPALAEEARLMPQPPIAMVHPKLFGHVQAALAVAERPSLKVALGQVPAALAAAIKRRTNDSAVASTTPAKCGSNLA